MDPQLHGLHPLKRFKLRQQIQQQEEDESLKSSSLPAKKRKNHSPPPPPPSPDDTDTIFCLPAKKRVWAPQPETTLFATPQKQKQKQSIFSFDLNVEYQQSPEKEAKSDEEDGVVCCVCQSTDGDPTDPIVFCDGCDVMVHATCYGDPLIKSIPEGDWFCATCQHNKEEEEEEEEGSLSSSSSSYKCCLCPVKGGVMKPTTDGRWAHTMCALLVPEVFFRDPEGRQGIDCSVVPNKRWKDVCYICSSNSGCAIECSESTCSLAFHVSCGLNEDLCIEYKQGKSEKTGGLVVGFCQTHTQLWIKEQKTGKFKIVPREGVLNK